MRSWDKAHIIPRHVEEQARFYQQALAVPYTTKDGRVRKLGELELKHLQNIARILGEQGKLSQQHIVKMVIEYKELNHAQ
jgi:hypothetical protein